MVDERIQGDLRISLPPLYRSEGFKLIRALEPWSVAAAAHLLLFSRSLKRPDFLPPLTLVTLVTLHQRRRSVEHAWVPHLRTLNCATNAIFGMMRDTFFGVFVTPSFGRAGM